jgi:hypothetical protein
VSRREAVADWRDGHRDEGHRRRRELDDRLLLIHTDFRSAALASLGETSSKPFFPGVADGKRKMFMK